MAATITLTALVQPTVSGLSFLTSSFVHPTYFPYLWAQVLHAARISLVYQSLAKKAGNRISWGAYIAGFLVTCWTGGVVAQLIVGLTPAQMTMFQPYICYVGVHLALTAFFHLFPSLLVTKLLDTVLVPLDGLLRAVAVAGVVSTLANDKLLPPNTPLKSAFGHMVLGVIASAGGGVALSTFSLFSSEWKFSTPPILTPTIWSSADVWGGALAGILYGALTHQAAFTIPSVNPASLNAGYYPLNILPQQLLEFVFKAPPSAKKPTAFHFLSASPVPVPQARAYVALLFTFIFASRVLFTHWLVDLAPVPVQKPKVKKGEVKEKAKAQ